MDHQGFGIPHVGEVTGQLQAVDEAHGIVVAALEGEHQHAAHAPPGQVFPGCCVVGITGQAGVTDMGHLGVLIQPGRQGHGVLGVAFHPQAEGFQPLKQQEAVEGADRWTPVPQPLNPGAQGKGDVAVVGDAEHFADVTAEAEGIPVHQAVVRRAGLAHQREFAVAPVKGAGINDHASEAGAVATDPLGGAFDDHIRTVLDRSHQGTTGPQGVVHDQRDAAFLGQG